MKIMGIDIGGSGIKGAPVEVETGLLVGERYRLATPEPSSPDAVGNVVAKVVKHFKWKGPVGCTIPSVVRDGVAYTAANIDQGWIGTNGRKLLQRKTRCPVFLLNDADAAGVAEMEFGAGRGQKGVVIVLTFGTGIGSAIFVNGQLVPNTELGHMELRGKDAEWRVSDHARQEKVPELEEMGWACQRVLGTDRVSVFSRSDHCGRGREQKAREILADVEHPRSGRPSSITQRCWHRRCSPGGQGPRVKNEVDKS